MAGYLYSTEYSWIISIGNRTTCCPIRPSPIWQSEEFFQFNSFQIGQACSSPVYTC